jgi:hypothetical protein
VAKFNRIKGCGGEQKNELEIVCVISRDKESDTKKNFEKKRKEKKAKKQKMTAPGFDWTSSSAGYPDKTPRSVLHLHNNF